MGWLNTVYDAGKNYAKNNAGSIAAGVAGAVLGSGKNKTNSKQTSSITSVPAWMSDYAQQLMSQATLAAAQPYTAYQGPRVAGLTHDQLDAANMVRGNVGQGASVIQDAMGRIDPNAGQGMLAKAKEHLSNAGGSWLDNSGRFMDDYKASVTNPAVTQARREWDEQINPSIQGTFAGNKGVGAFGSDAMLRTMTGAGSRLSEKLGENMAGYLDRGYNAGMGQFNTENTQQGSLAQLAAALGRQEQDMNTGSANTMADLAKAWQQMNTQDTSALSAIGQQQQQLNQAAMDVDYGNWNEAKNYDKDQIAYLQAVLNGNAPFGDRTVSNTGANYVNASPLQGAADGIGIFNSIAALLNKNKNVTPPAGQPEMF